MLLHIDEIKNIFFFLLNDSVFVYKISSETFLYYCKYMDWPDFAPEGAKVKKKKRVKNE